MVMQLNKPRADVIILSVTNNFATLKKKWEGKNVMEFPCVLSVNQHATERLSRFLVCVSRSPTLLLLFISHTLLLLFPLASTQS